MKILVALIILLAGCDEYRIFGGAALHSNNIDGGPNDLYWQDTNPIGFIRAEANTDLGDNMFIGTQFSHESIIFFDDDTGFNYIGLQGGFVFK